MKISHKCKHLIFFRFINNFRINTLKRIEGYVPTEPYFRRKRKPTRHNLFIQYPLEENSGAIQYYDSERQNHSPKPSFPNSARLDHFGKQVRDQLALRLAQNPIKKERKILMHQNSLPALLKKKKVVEKTYSFSFFED